MPPRTLQADEQPEEQYVSVSDLDRIIAEKLAERDAEHAAQLAALRNQLPVAMVPMHGGGPGIDQHRRSWSKVEQEMSAAGTWTEPEAD